MNGAKNFSYHKYKQTDTGKRIRRLRKQNNMTCKEMSEKLGGTERDYMEIEEGKCSMSLETALQLASLFHVTLDYLVYGADKGIGEELPESEIDRGILSLLDKSKPQQRELALQLMQAYLQDERYG